MIRLAGLISECYPDKELTEGDLIDLEEYTGTIIKMYQILLSKYN